MLKSLPEIVFSLNLTERLEWEKDSPNSARSFFFHRRGGEFDLLLSYASPSPNNCGIAAPGEATPTTLLSTLTSCTEHRYYNPLSSLNFEDDPLSGTWSPEILPS
ncbi:hypothetical protein VNO80_27034 [Phaseolus coccineus]|uniref:Uncharacterized protein n=1 Tax=Phaseolus coccineus TaxID=3886 RepID=A0AAN9LJ47_PHACN